VQDTGVLEAHAVLGSQRSSTSPDCWSTGLVVLARLESVPMRSWIPRVEGKDMGWLQVYVGAARMRVQEARG
jgi:hypothetical protein